MAGTGKMGLGALAAGILVGTLGAGTASADPIRIFAIGDSITDGRDDAGSPSTGGYRQLLSSTLDLASIDHVFQGMRGNQAGAKWERHWGRPGISADNWTVVDPYASTPYHNTRSLVNDFVDRANVSPTGIRHPSIYGTHDFRTHVWGTSTAPTHTLLHIGTNTITNSASSVTSAVTQVNALLRTFDLLDSTLVPGGGGSTFMRADGTILFANIIPKAVSFDTLANTFDYNAAISDKSSDVYDNLTQDFIDRIQIVDMFKVRVDDVIDGIHARTGIDLGVLLGYLQRDGDEWVDWIEDYDEALGLPLSASLVLNDVLWKKNTNTYDSVHPGVWGYEVMAQVWANAIPEPTALALVVIGGLGLAFRRRPAATC